MLHKIHQGKELELVLLWLHTHQEPRGWMLSSSQERDKYHKTIAICTLGTQDDNRDIWHLNERTGLKTKWRCFFFFLLFWTTSQVSYRKNPGSDPEHWSTTQFEGDLTVWTWPISSWFHFTVSHGKDSRMLASSATEEMRWDIYTNCSVIIKKNSYYILT